MLKIINTKFGKGKLALLGGLMINTDGEEDFFVPKYF